MNMDEYEQIDNNSFRDPDIGQVNTLIKRLTITFNSNGIKHKLIILGPDEVYIDDETNPLNEQERFLFQNHFIQNDEMTFENLASITDTGFSILKLLNDIAFGPEEYFQGIPRQRIQNRANDILNEYNDLVANFLDGKESLDSFKRINLEDFIIEKMKSYHYSDIEKERPTKHRRLNPEGPFYVNLEGKHTNPFIGDDNILKEFISFEVKTNISGDEDEDDTILVRSKYFYNIQIIKTATNEESNFLLKKDFETTVLVKDLTNDPNYRALKGSNTPLLKVIINNS